MPLLTIASGLNNFLSDYENTSNRIEKERIVVRHIFVYRERPIKTNNLAAIVTAYLVVSNLLSISFISFTSPIFKKKSLNYKAHEVRNQYLQRGVSNIIHKHCKLDLRFGSFAKGSFGLYGN